MQATQIVKTVEEKAASKAKAEAKKVKKTDEKKKRGRPKGSKNKDKQEVVLNPEFEKGEAQGSRAALELIDQASGYWVSQGSS